MKTDKYNRKKFFKQFGSVTAASVLVNMLPFSSAHAEPHLSFSGDPGDDYLFSEGLTYLNTGTLGPCRNETIKESIEYWKQLESFPVQFYGGFGAEALAEKTGTKKRTQESHPPLFYRGIQDGMKSSITKARSKKTS